MAKKKQEMTSEEWLAEALVREEDWPYGVPGNWVWVKLSTVTINFDSMRVPLSKTQRLHQNKTYDYYGASGVIDKVENYIFDKRLLLVGEDGANLLTRSKPIAFIADGKYWVNNHAHIMDSNGSIGLDFLCYYINSIDLSSFVTGSAQPKMTQEKMRNIPIPLPPLAEQQRIVDRIESLFDKLDQAKELIQEALDSFENRKAAILHQAFTGELTKKWREAHGVGVESWEECQFQDIIFETKLGIVRNLNEQSESFEYKYLKMNNIDRHGNIDFNNITKVNASKTEIERYCLKYGDFLFNTRNSRELVGKNAIWKEFYQEIILFNNNIMRVRFTENVISDFISYYFNSIKGKADLDKIKKVTTNVAAIYAKDLKKIIVPLPSITEQLEIVRILDDLFAKEQNAKDLCDLIDQIEAIKKTILGKAFRGELGTNEAEEESAVALLKQVFSDNNQAK